MVKIFDTFFKQRRRYFSKKPKADITAMVREFKDELDDYREAINANSTEIQETYSHMGSMGDKLDKLGERLERIECFLQMNSSFTVEQRSFTIQPLSKQEQHVFLVVYSLEDEKGLISCSDIAKKTGLPHYLVADYIARLVEKGVPIMRKYVNNIPYLKLNPEFKRVQAIENVLNIDTAQKELVQF